MLENFSRERPQSVGWVKSKPHIVQIQLDILYFIV